MWEKLEQIYLWLSRTASTLATLVRLMLRAAIWYDMVIIKSAMCIECTKAVRGTIPKCPLWSKIYFIIVFIPRYFPDLGHELVIIRD